MATIQITLHSGIATNTRGTYQCTPPIASAHFTEAFRAHTARSCHNMTNVAFARESRTPPRLTKEEKGKRDLMVQKALEAMRWWSISASGF